MEGSSSFEGGMALNDSYATGEFVTIPKPEGMHDRKQDESHPS